LGLWQQVLADTLDQTLRLGSGRQWHADDDAGVRNYLVLAKPNVIMNDIRLRGLAVAGSDAAKMILTTLRYALRSRRGQGRPEAAHLSLRIPRQPAQTAYGGLPRLRVKEDKVVVLMELDFEGVSREDVEALSNDMNARENPPTGLIAHVVTDTANGIHAVDIWESAADFQRFNQEQLMPSTKKIAQERGL